jgi:exopolysaccharide production protein ExoQ
MPPQLALCLTGLFVVYLFWRDSKQQYRASPTAWIPCIWLMILGSRPVSQWLDPTAFQSAEDIMDGSPTDRLVYLGLIVAGCVVLWRRQIPWGELFRNNVWLTVFYMYCGASVLWSDFPFIAFKRWIKGLGDPMIALILLSDSEPTKAVETVMKRCAYVLIPLSIVFIKYYPHLGRQYSEWTGAAYYTGVTANKNLLGYLLLVFGLFFLCALLEKPDRHRDTQGRATPVTTILFLLMIYWLFTMADSKTPLLALLAASLAVAGLRVERVRNHFGPYAVAAVLVCAMLQLFFNATEAVLANAGRDTTFTGRTELWESVLSMRVNPLVGAGFESFWLGDRLKKLWAEFAFKPTQAHNGYLEIYLNLGLIGLCLLSVVLYAAYKNVNATLVSSNNLRTVKSRDAAFATFGMAYLVAYVLYNTTEATIQELNFLFIIFLLVTIKFPRGATSSQRRQRLFPVVVRPSAMAVAPDHRSLTWAPAPGAPQRVPAGSSLARSTSSPTLSMTADQAPALEFIEPPLPVPPF